MSLSFIFHKPFHFPGVPKERELCDARPARRTQWTARGFCVMVWIVGDPAGTWRGLAKLPPGAVFQWAGRNWLPAAIPRPMWPLIGQMPSDWRIRPVRAVRIDRPALYARSDGWRALTCALWRLVFHFWRTA